MLPCGVNLVAFISRLIRTCCRRESSVSMGISSSSVVNVSSACVCFTLFTVSITFLQMLTASCCAIQNCSLPNSRLDRSITSLISFSNSSEFCWITSLHWRRVSSSSPSSVNRDEKPDNALSGVRISWLMFERNTLFARMAFSAFIRDVASFWVESFTFSRCLLSRMASRTNNVTNAIVPTNMLVMILLYSLLLAVSALSTWYFAFIVLICRI